jgi:hypothetical protein
MAHVLGRAAAQQIKRLTKFNRFARKLNSAKLNGSVRITRSKRSLVRKWLRSLLRTLLKRAKQLESGLHFLRALEKHSIESGLFSLSAN